MNFKSLEIAVMKDEGFRATPYLDSVGVPTIGYGTTVIMGKKVTMDDPAINPKDARHLLRADLYGAGIDAQDLFKHFDKMNDVRQEVLVNMAYNLGRRGLGGFKKMLAAAKVLDYSVMAEEMTDSKWYEQVGKRAVRLVNEMRFGHVV